MITIRSRRAAIEAVRHEVLAAAEQEIAVRTARLQAELDAACLALYRESGTVAAVQRAYGTKDFRTVREILARAQRAETPLEAESPYTAVRDDTGADWWTVTDTRTGVSVRVEWLPDAPKPLTSRRISTTWPLDTAQENLYSEIRDTQTAAHAALRREAGK